jgi:hypothetical protein
LEGSVPVGLLGAVGDDVGETLESEKLHVRVHDGAEEAVDELL